jgi:hypothetical protein
MSLRDWLHRRTGKIIGGIFLLVVGIALIVSMLWATNALGWREWRLNEVQAFIGAELPSEARDVQFATDHAKTRIVWLRFTLPAETSLADFLFQMGVETAFRQGFSPFPGTTPIEAALTWWTPHTAQTYSGLHAIHGGQMVELLLDQTDVASPIVYLRAYILGMG